jgi:hypothetical protein
MDVLRYLATVRQSGPRSRSFWTPERVEKFRTWAEIANNVAGVVGVLLALYLAIFTDR